MKNLKLKKIADVEILTNPTILFETDVIANEMTLSGHKIGDNVDTLELDKIKSAWGESCVIIIEVRTKAGKFISRTESDIFLLEKRIDAVKNDGGWLGYDKDISFHITNRKIDSFSIHSKRISIFNTLSMNKLIERLGTNTEKKEMFDEFNGPFTVIINFERQILITWEDDNFPTICLGNLAIK